MRNPPTNTVERSTCRAFTLVELLVSVVVITIIILMVAQMMSSATAITRTGNKHIDTDAEARTVFDRMAVDFGKMLKRSDIDYWLKQQGARYYPGHSAGHSNGKGHTKATTQQGSDQIAFYSQVPGYYPSTTWQSPISLVAYRVNTTTYQLERMGKGLLWNGVSNPNQAPNNTNYTSPIVFLPLLINDRWPAATSGTTPSFDYEVIGPHVFRFEYHYLLTTDATSRFALTNQFSSGPWADVPGATSPYSVLTPAGVKFYRLRL